MEMDPAGSELLGNTIRQRLRAVYTQTTFHGYRELGESRNVLQKCFWFLVLFSCTSMFSWQTKKQIDLFIKGRTGTRVIRANSNAEYRYPPVWICVPHWFWIDNEKLLAYSLTYEDLKVAQGYVYAEDYDSNVSISDAKIAFNEKLGALNLTNVIDLYSLITYDDLLSGDYSPGVFTNKLYSLWSGACYQMNVTKVGTVNRGRSRTVAFEFDFASYRMNTRETANFSKYGINETDLDSLRVQPFLLNMDTGQTVPMLPQHVYQISTNSLIYRQLDNCRENTSSYTQYLTKVCKLDCELLANTSLKTSSCVAFLARDDFDIDMTPSFQQGRLPLCHVGLSVNGTVTDREEPIFRDLLLVEARKLNEDVARCGKTCLPKCEQWMTTWSVIDVNLEVEENSISRVDITFPDNEHLMIVYEVEQYSWNDLLSDIGGLLGFYLGGSVMSLFQLAQLFFWTKIEAAQPQHTSLKMASHSSHL